jgi:hypothetical protein
MRVARFASPFSSSPWAPRIVGSVLLTAAALKGHALFINPSSNTTLLQSTWFQAVLVGIEAGCGFALWLLLWPRTTRAVGMLLFAGLFGAALSQGLVGQESCACFGQMQFHPWLAVLLDASMFALLVCWNTECVVTAPVAHPRSIPTERPPYRRSIAFAALAVPQLSLTGSEPRPEHPSTAYKSTRGNCRSARSGKQIVFQGHLRFEIRHNLQST